MRRTTGIEAPTGYLFQCKNDAALFAVSLQSNAGNIPPSTAWYGGWRLHSEFALGLDEPAPAEIDMNPVLRGVRTVGYYVWRNGLA
jgi:hypothetical protein